MMILRNPFFFIGAVALAFFILTETVSYYDEFEKAELNSYKTDKLILKNLTQAQSKNVEILADVLSTDSVIIDAYINNEPELIKEHVAPIWKKVKDKKLTYEIHFFKPPAISFVNFSDFKSIGKDVSDVRSDILWVTSSFQPSSHALMCKSYAGYRATHPIYDIDGNILGGLSLGKKIDWIPNAIKEKTTHDSFLVYTESSTNALAGKYYDEFMKDKEPFGEYLLAEKTFKVVSEDIKNIDFSKEMQTIEIEDKGYFLYTYPIIDFNNEILGYICTVTQLKEFKENFLMSVFQHFIIIVLSALVVFLITRFKIMSLYKEIDFMKKMTKKIKGRNFGFLHHKSINSEVITESLVGLQSDILDMGLELEKQYVELEDENREKTQQLIKQLYIDDLTGLANRNALFRDLKKCPESFIAILNIRNFKDINDAFGFEVGNHILTEIAQRFEAYTKRNGYSFYRVGSDEYVLAKFNEESPKEFEKFVVDFMDKIEQTTFNTEHKSENIDINMYAGLCFDKSNILEKADMALTQAKKSKREFVVYSPESNTREIHIGNIETINKIKKALTQEEILVYYQAIVDNKNEVYKYEALVRMKDGNKILSPFSFLEISKKTKYYSLITQIVIQKSFSMIEHKECSISINLTADDILNNETIELITFMMQECSHPDKVVFELVETDDLYNLKEINDFIVNMKKLGAKIAIDDFGTGYSNFSYMMKIEPDYIKIDGSLIKNLDSDLNAKKIVTTIVSFANQLNIKTIAEFVHSQEIFEICKELGVDEFQGYYFSEPHPL